MKRKKNYIKRIFYIPAPIAIIFREKLKRDPTNKELYQALLEKLDKKK